MGKHRNLNIAFPLAGLNRKSSYRQSPPYATIDCLNVLATGPIEGRERGGSRPGLVDAYRDNSGAPWRFLVPMTLALGDNFTCFSDTFSGMSMAEAWTAATWTTVPALPLVLPSALVSVDTTLAEGEAVLDTLPIDTTKAYSVEMLLVPWAGAWHGKYRLYLRLDDTTPDIETDGVVIELVQTGSTGAYTASLKSVVETVETTVDTDSGAIVPQVGWLSASVSGTTVTVYWNGTQILTGTVGAQAGSRVGFGMECTVDGGLCLANVFRVQYYSTGSVPSLRTMLIGSSGGDLYKQTFYGRMEKITSNLTVRDDVPLMACQSGQKLYIADYGDVAETGTDGSVAGTTFDASGVSDWTTKGILPYDMVVVISNVTGSAIAGTYKIQTVSEGSVTLATAAGTGSCAYRIERAPKVYDPLTNTISILTATAGEVPTGNPIIWHYLDRICLAGAEIAPHVWYMSRVSSETDWDYSQIDSQTAIAGTASDAGLPGDPIVTGLSHSDDYAIVGCLNSIWRFRGDPAYGGSLDVLSHAIGIIGPKAWCLGPAGEMIFLSLDGIYYLAPGGDSYPTSISRETLPHEFLNINPSTVTASLEYDVQRRLVHIYLTPDSSNARVHWMMDLDKKTFWPQSLDSDHEPTATCCIQSTTIEDSGVLLGCRDGTIRTYSDLAETDCGISYDSHIIIGPVPLAADSGKGAIVSMDVVLAENSGPMIWYLRPGLTYEECVNTSTSDTGTVYEGLNSTIRPACGGQAYILKLVGTPGRKWALEQITTTVKDCGKRRIS